MDSTEVAPEETLTDLVIDLSALNLQLRKAGDQLATAMLVGGNVEKADALQEWRRVTGLVRRD